MSRLKDFYEAEIIPEMTKKFSYKNKLAVPKLEKIIINMGVGEARENAKVLDGAVNDMTIISGQKPMITKAKKSIANFKLREGMNIGCKVTLRGARMYEFADRLINIALPRVRDFRGVKANSFDGRGNYTMGIKNPWTLENEWVWKKTHAAGGIVFILMGLCTILNGFLPTPWMAQITVGIILLGVLGLEVYSYLLFKSLRDGTKE